RSVDEAPASSSRRSEERGRLSGLTVGISAVPRYGARLSASAKRRRAGPIFAPSPSRCAAARTSLLHALLHEGLDAQRMSAVAQHRARSGVARSEGFEPPTF